jgi:hypothetical protein
MGRPATKSLEARWSTEDLVRRLGHALDIAKQAVDRLAARGYSDPGEPANNLRPEKVIAETAFLLLGASRAGEHPEVREQIRDLAEHLIPYARGERMVLGLCLEPALALDYAQAHICLARLGHPDAGFDAVLERALDSQSRAGRERPPHRVLEQLWLEGTWNGSRSNSGKRQPAAARNSVLGRPMDLLGGSRDDVYAFTHALMYATDFSLLPRHLPRPASVILTEAEAALGRSLDEQDYDLAGEVTLAWPLSGRPWTAAAAFGFRVLAWVEDQAGFLPSQSTKLQRLNELKGDERSDYLLATAYHTAYVMGLLCAAALQSGKAPPAEIPRARLAVDSAAEILPFLDADGRSVHWRAEFDRLEAPQRNSIAGLLLAIALRRKASQRDFAGLREVLAMGYKLGLADSPAASQAAELLERLVTAAPILASMRREPLESPL